MPSIDSSFVTNATCIHVSDLKKSVAWYIDNFQMSEIKTFETTSYVSSFVALDSDGHLYQGKPLVQRNGVVELRKLKGVSPKVYDGNSEPYKGFGHLCVAVSNIAESQKELLAKGVTFKKKLEDGRQHNIAFVLDPDGYWVELIENAINKKDGVVDYSSNRMNHSMIRVKDPKKSLEFYKGVLGMKLYSIREFPEAQFNLYFLGYEHSPDYVEEKETSVPQASRQSIVELTWNYGTESDDSSYYVFGKDKDVVGFEHIAISCKDAKKFTEEIGDSVNWVTKYDTDPEIKKIAVVADPDGYKIQIQSYDAFN
ncbi:hypothetical protein CANARDRAFT_29351 [[Candida] arabinofermentans NRRL YB-2248]|uniref:Aldoketomutase n=1 Tax=[Candida] arabinofermentans NRRL YB-2248 TaxID=983967 RepID=A0A1E4SXH2_9ASCO|nr:hypothetical protein CANARDRAFT_29351 [[Candida] arabinofermentans NRRL YB-2248]